MKRRGFFGTVIGAITGAVVSTLATPPEKPAKSMFTMNTAENTIYVVWMEGDELSYRRSLDGGATWQEVEPLPTAEPPGTFPVGVKR